jgi:hypothetical protein
MRLAVAVLIVAFVSLLSGCCGEEHDENNGGMDAGSNMMMPVDAGPPPDVDNTGVQYASEYATRINRLEFTSVPASELNGIISLNLDLSFDEPIILLYEFTDLDPEAGTAEVTANSGVKGGGMSQFKVDSDSVPSTAALMFDPPSGEFEALFETYHFVATIEFDGDVQRVDIPVRDLTVSGVLALSDDGTTATIPAGEWDGHVTKADADGILVTLGSERTLTEMFREETLNFDSSSGEEVPEGTGDAWHIEAIYEASSAEIVE